MVTAILIEDEIAKNKVKKSKDFGAFWLGEIVKIGAFKFRFPPFPNMVAFLTVANVVQTF